MCSQHREETHPSLSASGLAQLNQRIGFYRGMTIA
jgi:hypothetical protein